MKTESVKSATINFAVYSVKDKETGDWDVDATIEKFTTQLRAADELQRKDQPALANAIEAIFAAAGTAKLQKDSIITMALAKVGFEQSNFNTLKERAKIVLDSNPRYYSVLGAGGGTSRLSDKEYEVFQETGMYPHQIEAAKKKAALEAKKAAKASL